MCLQPCLLRTLYYAKTKPQTNLSGALIFGRAQIAVSVLFLLLAAVGCDQPRKAMPTRRLKNELTPVDVHRNFAEQLMLLANRYPELAKFPSYYASLQEKTRIRYSDRIKPINSKRTPSSGDFEENGISLQFDLCSDKLPVTPTTGGTMRIYRNLGLRLFTEIALSESPSAGLRDELERLVSAHILALDELEAANSQSSTNTN
jgi:hypothetical protein